MQVLKDLINEFAVFSMPTDKDQLPGDSSMGDGESPDSEVDFNFDPTGGDEASDEDEMDCECNCPSHKKFDKEGSIEDNDNIEIIDRKDSEGGDPEFSLDDEEEDETSNFKLF